MNLITYDEFKERSKEKSITIRYEGYDFHDINKELMVEVLEKIVASIIKTAELGHDEEVQYPVDNLDDKFILILQALFLKHNYYTELKEKTLIINWNKPATKNSYFFLESKFSVEKFLDIIPSHDDIVRYITPKGRLDVINNIQNSINVHLLDVAKYEEDNSLEHTVFRYTTNNLNERIVYILKVIANEIVNIYHSLGFNIKYIYDFEYTWLSYKHIFDFHFDLTSKYEDKDEQND